MTHDPKRGSFGGDNWRRAALVAVGKSHQHPTGPTAVIKHFSSQQWKAGFASNRLFHYYMLTPWHKGRDQNNVAGLSYSSHAFILPTSADSLIVISVWADTHLAHTEFGDCCYSPRKTFSERKRWKTRTHLLGFSIFPLPCSLATINTPEETRQLIELPLCCHTSGKESKQSCKSKRSKRFKAWHFFLKALRRGCLHESLDAVRAQKKKPLSASGGRTSLAASARQIQLCPQARVSI